mgnify:CR=1 FL=1
MTKDLDPSLIFINKKIKENKFVQGMTFQEVFEEMLDKAVSLDIVSGYVDKYIPKMYGDKLIELSQNGQVRIIIGMAEKEGLHKSTHEQWGPLDNALRLQNKGSGVFAPTTKIHAKVYKFLINNLPNIYVGSSNFSISGFRNNIEGMVKVISNKDINDQIELLFSDKLLIDFKDIEIKNSPNYKKRREIKELTKSKRHKQFLSPNELSGLDLVKIDLKPFGKPDKFKSSLNLFHGSGRFSSKNNTYTPRPWYEVELTIGDKNYLDLPQEFEVNTDDGYIFNMKRSGGGKVGKPETQLKNLASTPGRLIFGEWIKSKLEKSEVLDENDLITKETFESYGKDTLDFYKLDENKYYLNF